MITLYTIVFLASLIIGIMFGLPIAYSLLLSGAATALAMGGTATNAQIVAAQLMRGTDSVTMMALPFFILVGELMNRGGLTKQSARRARLCYNTGVFNVCKPCRFSCRKHRSIGRHPYSDDGKIRV